MHDQLRGGTESRTASRDSADLAWPFVGRDRDLDGLRRTLAEHPRGLVVVGDLGVGKSALLGVFADRLADDGWAVSRHRATEARSAIPFAPFLSLLDGAPGIDDPLERLFAATSALRAGEGPVLMSVDDAQWLDPESLAFVQHVADTTDVAVLLSLTRGHDEANGLLAFGRGLRLGRVDVDPLERKDVARLLAAVRPDVLPADVHELWQVTRGNPLFLHEMARHRVERLGPGQRVPSSLTDIVGERLGELDPEERLVLELVAVGGYAPFALLQGRAGVETVAGLERRGLLVVEESGRRLIGRLGHPLDGQVLTGQMGVARQRLRRGELLDDLRRCGARRRSDHLSLAVWGLDQGEPVDPDLLLAVARRLVTVFGEAPQGDEMAHRGADPSLSGDRNVTAARLTRAASDHGGGFVAAQCWFGIESRLDASSTATGEALARMARDATTDAERVIVAAAHLSVDVLAGGRGERTTVDDLEALAAASTDPIVRDHVAATLSLVLYLTGRFGDSVARGRSVLTSPCADLDDRYLAAATVAAGLMGSGRAVEALAMTELPLVDDGPPPDRYRVGTLLLARVAALAAAGRFGDAEGLATAVIDGAGQQGDEDDAGLFHLGVAEISLVRGRPGDALAAASGSWSSSGTFGPGSPVDLSVQAGALCALAHATRGEAVEATAALARLDGSPSPASPFALLPARARAWEAVVTGRRREAVVRLNELAVQAPEHRHATMLALHDLVRLGERGAGTRMAHLVDQGVEGAYWAAAAAHGRAFDDGDGHALDEAAAALAGLGAALVAAEAASQAADAHVAARNHQAASASRRKALALAAECQGSMTPALVSVAAGPGALTERELAVARLAAGGATNRAIAAELHLSVRTTETYLYRAYFKLGLRSRGELVGRPEL